MFPSGRGGGGNLNRRKQREEKGEKKSSPPASLEGEETRRRECCGNCVWRVRQPKFPQRLLWRNTGAVLRTFLAFSLGGRGSTKPGVLQVEGEAPTEPFVEFLPRHDPCAFPFGSVELRPPGVSTTGVSPLLPEESLRAFWLGCTRPRRNARNISSLLRASSPSSEAGGEIPSSSPPSLPFASFCKTLPPTRPVPP